MTKTLLFAAVSILGLTSARAGDLDVARAALRDGLWDVARSHAARVEGDGARAIVLESYALEEKWDKVRESLEAWGNPEGDLFDYYRAAVDGDVAKAAFLLRKSGVAAAIVEAEMLEADVMARAGKRAEAESAWRRVVASTNASERAYVMACINLGEVALLSNACRRASTTRLKRLAGLRLGTVLLADAKSAAAGEELVRRIVRESPDVPGGMEAFAAILDAEIAAGKWTEASETLHRLTETWPDAAKSARVQSARGWVLLKSARREEALEAFRLAHDLSTDDEAKAFAALKRGDVLSELGRNEEAMAVYRDVLKRFPKTASAARLKTVVDVRELEARGREAYRQLRFADAQKAFAEVAAKDPSRKARMDFFTVLCLFGQGLDTEAYRKAAEVVEDADDPGVRSEAMLWFAKFLFNRGEWKASRQFFSDYAESVPAGSVGAQEALLWSARASFAEGNFTNAIAVVSRIVEKESDAALRPQALLLQGEALIELARFDEAVLVLERVAVEAGARDEDRARAQILMADALLAMGADNPARYTAALEAYRAVRFGGALGQSARLVVAFKIGRVLEKLKRTDEAVDQFYTQVILAYCNGRERGEAFDDEARAAFSRAAFWLVDEYESRGKEAQAMGILRLVVHSDVPAADEAAKRMERISRKGGFL